MSTVILVLCAGNAVRWENYMGIQKHLINIDGETLLDRTLRLIRKQKPKVYIVSNDESYSRPGATLYRPTLDENLGEGDKYLSSCSLWNTDGRTIILLGDVWYSTEAMETILEFSHKEWQTFGRVDKSQFTKCPYGELFAFSFYPEHIKQTQDLLLTIKRAPSGWKLFKLFSGFPVHSHDEKLYLDSKHFTNIDDFTDDFDYPQDYDRWIVNFKKHYSYIDHKLELLLCKNVN